MNETPLTAGESRLYRGGLYPVPLYGTDGSVIAYARSDNDALRLAQAVNEREALIAALQQADAAMREAFACEVCGSCVETLDAAIAVIRALLPEPEHSERE